MSAKGRRWMVAVGIGLVVVGAIAAIGSRALASRIPAPTGSSPVGRSEFIWTDAAREDPWVPSKHEKREIKVYVWYPASQAKGASTAVYFPDLPKLSGVSFFERAVLERATIDALESPPIAAGSFPVILFSPGNGNPTAIYAGIFEELASQGFIVAAIEHTHEGMGQVLSKGVVAANVSDSVQPKPGVPNYEKVAADYFAQVMKIRSDDFTFVLNQLEALNRSDPRFKGKLKVDRVATLGHSLGGVAAAQAALKDHRFISAVNLDGLTYGRSRLPSGPGEQMLATFLHLGKPLRQLTDEELKKDGVTREQSDAAGNRLSQRADAVLNEVKGGAYRVLVKGAVHRAFSDDPFLDPGLKGQQYVLDAVRPLLVEFFDVTLRGGKPNRLAKAVPMEGVTLERFGK